MWFITLLVLAVAAVLIIKAVKAHSSRLSASTDDSFQGSGLQGSLKRPPATNETGPSAITPESQTSEPEQSTTNMTPAGQALDQGNSSSTLHDIQEMIKTLNLIDSDSPRLGISSDEFNALRYRESPGPSNHSLPDASTQADIAERLRRMLN